MEYIVVFGIKADIVNVVGIFHQLENYQRKVQVKKYGTAFWAVDETGSGCIGIGMENAGKRYFCKIAGVNTLEADVSPEESVEILKQSIYN